MDKNASKVMLFILIITLGYGLFLCTLYIKSEAKEREYIQQVVEWNDISKAELLRELQELQDQVLLTQEELDQIKQSQIETKILEMRIEMDEVEKITNPKEYYLNYMDVVNKYADYIDKPETIYDAYSEADIYLLQRMVETETHGAPFECKVNVANVAFNRIKDPVWPDTLESVLTQSHQFHYERTSITEDTVLAMEYAYMFPDTTQGALSFHSGEKTETFGKYSYIFSDSCGHHFYK